MHFRQVRPEEVAVVVDVLSSAAANLVKKGNELWGADEVSEVAVLDHVRSGMYYVAQDDQGPVGVFRFELEDHVFWPETPVGTSAFIHKIAVHPRKQGQDFSHALLRYAYELTEQLGRRFLRLDCISGRPKLWSVYERFGFKHHSTIKLGDRVFDRFELEVRAADALRFE